VWLGLDRCSTTGLGCVVGLVGKKPALILEIKRIMVLCMRNMGLYAGVAMCYIVVELLGLLLLLLPFIRSMLS